MNTQQDQVVTPITRERTDDENVTRQVSERLRRIDELEEMVETKTATIRLQKEELQRLFEQVGELEKYVKDKDWIDAETEALRIQRRELELEKQVAELKVKNAEQRVADHINMVGLIFRNPTVVKSGSVPVPVPGTRDCPGYVHDSNFHTTEETT